MSNDSRDLLTNWRKYRLKQSTLIINEDTNENQLTPQEIQGEIDEFKKAVSGIVTFNALTKTGSNFLFVRGQIKVGENTLNFNFKLDECTISTENLQLNDISIKVLNQLNGYYVTWVKKWQQNLSA